MSIFAEFITTGQITAQNIPMKILFLYDKQS